MQLGLGFWASNTVLSAVKLGVFSTLAGHDAEEAMRKKVEAARKSNAALAERIRLEGPKLAAALKALARDVALSLIETAALNQQIPPGVPPLRDPDSLARSIPAVPRENISEKLIEMWVRTSDGGLIGNQTDVVSEDGKIGHIQINRSLRVDCVRRKYRSIEYHPEDFPIHAEPFHTLMRLPD